MMKKLMLLVQLGVAVPAYLYAGYPIASFTSRGVDDPVVVGDWNIGFEKCIRYCEENDVPFFGVWSDAGCDLCTDFEMVMKEPTFKAAMQSNVRMQVVFCYMSNNDRLMANAPDQSGSPAHSWMRAGVPAVNGVINWPFVAFYWKSHNVNVHYSGMSMLGQYSYEVQVVPKLIGYFDTHFAGYTGPKPSYSGGVFPGGSAACAPGENELEVQVEVTNGVLKTTWVDVPVILEAPVEKPLKNLFWGECGGQSSPTNLIVWEVGGPTCQWTRLSVPTQAVRQQTIAVHLGSESGEIGVTASIPILSDCVNSVRNPKWLGEAFDFGQWTMDYVRATNMVRQAQGESYTLLLFTGVLWCPYCKGLEARVFETDDFRRFAQTNRVALVELDNPHRDDSNPTLLRREPGTADSGSGRQDSGLGYVSRNMISTTAGESVIAANHALGYETFLKPGKTRTGYPTVILLRKDGTVAGRLTLPGGLTTFKLPNGDAAYDYDKSATLCRLADLLAQARAADRSEESNDHFLTTGLTLPSVTTTPVSGTLSANDLADVYLVDGSGVQVEVSVAGEAAPFVSLRKWEIRGGIPQNPSEGTALEPVDIPLERKGGDAVGSITLGTDPVYLEVKANTAADSPFNAYADGASMRAYALTTRSILSPTDAWCSWTNETDFVDMATESGSVYRIVGMASVDPRQFVSLGEDRYEAVQTGTIRVSLAKDAASGKHVIACRLWNVGEVHFCGGSLEVSEAVGRLDCEVLRTGGGSGESVVRVWYRPGDSGNTPLEEERFALPGWLQKVDPENASRTNWYYDVAWADGKCGSARFPVDIIDDSLAEGGVHTVYFSLEKLAGAAELAAPDRLKLSIVENDDESSGGTVWIEETIPACVRTLQAVAREGSSFEVHVARKGTSESLSAKLRMLVSGQPYGEDAYVIWTGRRPSASAVMTLPLCAQADRVTIELLPLEGSGVVAKSGESVLTVDLVPVSGPHPSVSALTPDDGVWYQAVRTSQKLSVLAEAGQDVHVERMSGALPVGLKGVFDAKTGVFTLSGVPTSPGFYTATYQTYSILADGRAVKGESFTVSGEVVSLAAAIEANSPDAEVEADVASGGLLPIQQLLRTHIWRNAMVVGDQVDEAGRGTMQGVLSVCVAANGRASAKLTVGTGTFAYVSDGWDEFDADACSLLSRLRCARGGSGCPGAEMTVLVAADGTATASVPEAGLTCALYDNQWLMNGRSAVEWSGVYTVQLPQDELMAKTYACGDASLWLELASPELGLMTYAGVLPDGRTISGSAELIPFVREDGQDAVRLPLYVQMTGAAPSVFAGALEIVAQAKAKHLDARRSVYPCLQAYPAWNRTVGDEEIETRLNAFGGFWETNNLEQLCVALLGTSNLGLGLMSESRQLGWLSPHYGNLDLTRLPKQPVDVCGGELRAQATDGGTLWFDADYGMVSGTIGIPCSNNTVFASYRGAVLPGWLGVDNICHCAEPADQTISRRHFMSGACWFVDRLPGGRTFRNGFGVAIDVPDPVQ